MLGGSATEDKEQLEQLEGMHEEIKEQENDLKAGVDALIDARALASAELGN